MQSIFANAWSTSYDRLELGTILLSNVRLLFKVTLMLEGPRLPPYKHNITITQHTVHYLGVLFMAGSIYGVWTNVLSSTVQCLFDMEVETTEHTCSCMPSQTVVLKFKLLFIRLFIENVHQNFELTVTA